MQHNATQVSQSQTIANIIKKGFGTGSASSTQPPKIALAIQFRLTSFDVYVKIASRFHNSHSFTGELKETNSVLVRHKHLSDTEILELCMSKNSAEKLLRLTFIDVSPPGRLCLAGKSAPPPACVSLNVI